MFEVGFSELLLIMGLALLVLGPEKLPKVVTEIGRWMGRARAMARQFRDQLEIEAADSARRKTTASTNTAPASSPAETGPVETGPNESSPTDTGPIDPTLADSPHPHSETQPPPETQPHQDDERRAP